jgi:hypothetical protein
VYAAVLGIMLAKVHRGGRIRAEPGDKQQEREFEPCLRFLMTQSLNAVSLNLASWEIRISRIYFEAQRIFTLVRISKRQHFLGIRQRQRFL